MKNKILQIIKNEIKSHGFVDVEKFLKLSLYDENDGFYSNIDNLGVELLGSKGHFITSPEISQMFGELVGIWIIDFCIKSKNSSINLIELGPGRGTLMNDVLRFIFSNKSNKIQVNLHFLEKSKILSDLQYQKIKKYDCTKFWYKDFSELKKNIKTLPSVFIANEFFDCMPIQQFKLEPNSNIWQKVCLKTNHQNLYFSEIPTTKSEENFINKINFDCNFKKQNHNFIEYSAITSNMIDEISSIIKKIGGCALFFDYGKNNPYGNTIQAVYKNQKISILDKIGECDYSSLVDFLNMKNIAKKNGLYIYPISSQRDFLLKLGIKLRAERLAINANPLQKRILLSSLDRLIGKKHMGEIFKVFCMSKKHYNLLGFS